MVTNEKIEKERKKAARLERHLSLQKVKKRKADTRRKIELGGLVIKAKMDQYTKTVILGVLLEAKARLLYDVAYQKQLDEKGEKGFNPPCLAD